MKNIPIGLLSWDPERECVMLDGEPLNMAKMAEWGGIIMAKAAEVHLAKLDSPEEDDSRGEYAEQLLAAIKAGRKDLW